MSKEKQIEGMAKGMKLAELPADAVLDEKSSYGIKANTVLIDRTFAKVNGFSFAIGRDIFNLPPMICGLEVHVTDELPERYSFAVFEAPKTERERLVRKAGREATEKIIVDLTAKLHQMLPCKALPVMEDMATGNSFDFGRERALYDVLNILADLEKEYLGGTTGEEIMA